MLAAPPVASSLSEAAQLIVHWLNVPLPERSKAVARIKNLVRVGLIPSYSPGQGRSGSLDAEAVTRLAWASHANLCGLSPEMVAALLGDVDYGHLRGCHLTFALDRPGGRGAVEIHIRNPLSHVVARGFTQ